MRCGVVTQEVRNGRGYVVMEGLVVGWVARYVGVGVPHLLGEGSSNVRGAAVGGTFVRASISKGLCLTSGVAVRTFPDEASPYPG